MSGDFKQEPPTVLASVGSTGFFVALMPREESTLTASLTIDRLRPQFARVEGATCSCSFQRQLNTESAAALKL